MGNVSFAYRVVQNIHVYLKITVINIHDMECGQEGDRIRRYNSILKGINRIFSSIVNAETEEELGNACLSVALEITGSSFGFVAEVGKDGLLHDIAISEMGREQCMMHEKTGHLRHPEAPILYGLYGSVIDNEKSFFTNDPSSHSDIIGLPQGHPSLTSFLGVPLIFNGKVKGILAVANRKSGYSLAQQQDLEAIAPAVIQSLRRKREEHEYIRVKEELAAAHRQTQSIINNTPDIIYAFDLEERFVLANIAVANMLNTTPDQMIGKRRHEFMPKEDADWHEANDQKVFEAGRVLEFEEYSHLKDRWITWLTKKFPLRDAQGRIYAVGGISADITERKRAEEALQESEAKYRSIVETAQEGIWLIDQNDRTVFVNQKMSDMLGFSIDEISGQSPRKFMAPEFRIKAEDRLNEHMQGTKQVMDYRFIRKDGLDLWCILSSTPLFDNQGKYSGSLAMIMDITERKRAEEELRESEERKAFLLRLSDALRPIADPVVIQETASRMIAEYLDIGRVTYCKICYEPDIFVIVEHDWPRRDMPSIAAGRYRMDDFGTFLAEEFTAGRPAIVADAANDPRISNADRGIWQRFEIAASCGFPVIKEGKFVAYLVAQDNRRHDWTEREIALLHEVSERIWAAVERTSTETALRKSEEEYRRLSNTLEKKVKERTSELEQAYKFLQDIETVRKKEIHHRIKNNLQVISSLLDLQAEKFNNRECVKDSEILEAFKESQNRVISMALIHEELHKGSELNTLDFFSYIKELTNNLLLSYGLGNTNVSLYINIEENIFFNMDTAIPLGIIVNELISNSLKHAFIGRDKGEIQIKLLREKNGNYTKEGDKKTNFILNISDNGIGIPQSLNIEELDTLGFQLITSLVDQLDGEFELKRNNGTEFNMKFTVAENNNETLKPQQLIDL